MSPCRASMGLRKAERVPVDTRVMEIFCAMNPLFPTPVRKTTPLQSRMACGAVDWFVFHRQPRQHAAEKLRPTRKNAVPDPESAR